ncbi:hypothetical protein [Nocardia donostiensis]|uniref:Uncharacterized protein n=1 Tax=Nocardia donostiensis TaxID=1538463 RepID=A0A1V2TCI2_9NOCA|nr:hypothetical protein [Nocardia donostiensis]ONM47168.1 hypothetical protein B0T46_19570 [Nocardia donostiensis]OQS20153.1 hypothetical protein B0T44_11560 [Nocardia donostiensis]
MNDQPTPDQAVADAEVPTAEASVTESDTEQQSGNREAAKYRRQLRDTETERDQLRERVTAYERAEVERLVADHLADPADLWVAGTELDALRGKGGAVDPEKVKAAVAELLEQRPHWRKHRPPIAPPASLVSGLGRELERRTSWKSAFGSALGRD